MAELAKYTAELLMTLEEETGQATGYKQSGAVRLAKTEERMEELRRGVSMARNFGLEMWELSLGEIKDRWNPLGTAAAHAVIEEEDLCVRANELGSRLKQRLEAIRAHVPELAEVRGAGFMVAAEFNTADGTAPNAEIAAAIRAEALKRGLVLLTCGVYGNVIRFLAPITIPDQIFTEALDILEASVDAVKGV